MTSTCPGPVVMVENGLAITGWHANTIRARVISGGIPLRTWRLSRGNYRFTARYQEPDIRSKSRWLFLLWSPGGRCYSCCDGTSAGWLQSQPAK